MQDSLMLKTADNLELLADFIEEHAEPESIDMSWYVTGYYGSSMPTQPLQTRELIEKLTKVQLDKKAPITSEHMNNCGTSFCALGWEALRAPKVASWYSDWVKFRQQQFPALDELDINDEFAVDYCFGAEQSSNKEDVLARLRHAAGVVRGNVGMEATP